MTSLSLTFLLCKMGRIKVCLGVVLSATVIHVNAFRAVFTECDVVKCTQYFSASIVPIPMAAEMGTSAPHIPRTATKSPGIVGRGPCNLQHSL